VSGRLVIVGLGPGRAGLVAPDAEAALAAASDLIGYGPYLDRIAARPHQTRHASDNREEIERARHALALCASGRSVAVVSSGDAGVFAMASAVFEAMEAGPLAWRTMDVTVIPGISAMLAASARLGAPLGHDFCAISLSDNLKPWPLVCHRLRLAAQAGFVMALYNARSKARPNRLGDAFDVLRGVLPGSVPVVFATAISRTDERVDISTLAGAAPGLADMRTLVLIGSPETRQIAGTQFLYTPRSVLA